MRLFAAVYPSESAVNAWERFKNTAPKNWPLRWMEPPSLHFTLKFLGSIDPAAENKINGVLEQLSKSVSPFSLRFHGGGVFPPKGEPATFWIGTEGDVRILSELAHVAEMEFKNIGFAPENREYRAHMTVARISDKNRHVQSGFGREFSSWAESFTSEPFNIAQICLVESHLGPTGSTYSVRHSFPLK